MCQDILKMYWFQMLKIVYRHLVIKLYTMGWLYIPFPIPDPAALRWTISVKENKLHTSGVVGYWPVDHIFSSMTESGFMATVTINSQFSWKIHCKNNLSAWHEISFNDRQANESIQKWLQWNDSSSQIKGNSIITRRLMNQKAK